MGQYESTLNLFKERQMRIEEHLKSVQAAADQIAKGISGTGLIVTVIQGDHKKLFETEIMVYDKNSNEVFALVGWKLGKNPGITQMVEQVLNAMNEKISSFK